jgi:uncharacterized protein YcbK (DUF882 family)
MGDSTMRKTYFGTGAVLAVLVVGGLVTGGRGAGPAVQQEPAKVEQARMEKASERVSQPVAKTETCVRNCALAKDMPWQFGGKAQRGWYLYVPLIQDVVGTDAQPDSPDFAVALATWQKQRRVDCTPGVLDAPSWASIMSALQSARTKDATQCPTDELVEVPAEQWLYPDRPAELRHLRRDAYDAYLKMVAAARADLGADASGEYFRLISGHRSAEYQKQLRANAGNPSTAALAVNSPHFSGRAIDLYVGGEPVSTKDANRAIQVETPAYKWLSGPTSTSPGTGSTTRASSRRSKKWLNLRQE